MSNRSFVNEDPYVNFYLINSFLKHFNFQTGSVFPNPDAASVLPLPVQVTTPQGDVGYGAPTCISIWRHKVNSTTAIAKI